METDARSAVMERIRRAISAGNALPVATSDHAAEWAAIPRDYRRSSSSTTEELQHLLIDRLHDYDAQVIVSSAHEVADSIASMLHARGVSRILVPPGLRNGRLPPGFDFISETGLTFAEMDQCHGVLTESTLAIAETGTIVLQHVIGQGSRAASLIPDYHLCLVEAAAIVATVPQAIARLHATADLPTTFISGPSATADIEMTRIKGVHGPRSLDVLIIL